MSDSETPRPFVWFLSAEEFAATQAKLDRILTRAQRKGFSGDVSLDVRPATRTHAMPHGLPPVIEAGFEVSITGSPPRYAGWVFLAAVDAAPGGGVVVRYPPGAETEIANESLTPGVCDHCHTNRARRSTLLVRNDSTGEIRQVGSTCARDFLGWDTTPVLLDTDTLRNQLNAGGSAGTPSAWATVCVITYAWAAVKAFGWTPASAVGTRTTPTRDVVRTVLTGGRGSVDLLSVMAPHLPEAEHRALGLIADLLHGLTGESGYEANLTAVLRGDWVTAKHLGLAVSAVPAWERHHQQAPEHPDAPRPTVDYAGEIGDKITLTGVVRTALRVDGFTRHSPDNVLLVLDTGTTIAKMTTAATWAHDVRKGDTLTLTGTVKAHTEWRGTKQTVLVRPARIDNPDTASPPAVEPPATSSPVEAATGPSAGASPNAPATPAAAPAELWEVPHARFRSGSVARQDQARLAATPAARAVTRR